MSIGDLPMDSDVVVAVLGTLLGVGGTGGISLAVNAWRAHKKGKIEDEGTLIERLNTENQHLVKDREKSQRFERLWMTQAFKYRRQVVRFSDVEPDDMEVLWESGTPKVEANE